MPLVVLFGESAVDGFGDLYIADSGANTIFELPAGGALTPLVTTGLHDPTGIAVNESGDVFIADSGDNSIYELPLGGSLTPLVTSQLDDPTGVAVDSAGDGFIADTGDNAIYELPYGGTLTFIAMDPNGVAVSPSGNIYFWTASSARWTNSSMRLWIRRRKSKARPRAVIRWHQSTP